MVALAERCPQLKSLNLWFDERPALSLFPDMLHHTPALRQLLVDVADQGQGELEVVQAVLEDAEVAVQSLLRILCPACESLHIVL